MLSLRPYQERALTAIRDYWQAGGEHPLVVMATGVGKSLVQATLAKTMIEEFSGLRIVCVTHNRDLIAQNYKELLGEWPFAPAGIYSAGLGRRDSQSQILFCGIQSVHNKAKRIGHVDLVMIDEAHLLSKNSDTMYAKFLTSLLEINPDMRVIGFTATPYRTDSGRLDEGEERLFTEVIFDYGIADGINDDYLSPLVSKATDTSFDLSGVGRRGGDYIPGQLQDAVDKDSTTQAAVDEIVIAGAKRRSWLAFCAGVKHAEHVCSEIQSRGITCELITGETPGRLRDKWIEEHKSGALRCLCNVGTLTTGFNNPHVDLIAMLRPTQSAGLYIQMAGRGTRKAPGKENCVVLDFAGNVKRHGPVDLVTPRKPGQGDGESPVRECPECRSLVHISKKVCPDCDFVFPVNEKPKHAATSAAIPILSNEAPKWLNVQTRKFYYHENAEGSESVRVEFLANFVNYKLWLSVRKAKGRCDKFWRDHGGREPYPTDVEEWLDRIGELKETAQIQVRPKGKFFEIVGMKPAEQHAPPPEAVAIQKNRFATYKHDMDSDIPF